MSETEREILFLLASARRDGNSEILARRAAEHLPSGAVKHWVRLAEIDMPVFSDTRHEGSGVYPAPQGDMGELLERTLAATDLVFAAPLYWYGLPTAAKLYLDHWSGWLRVPGIDFKRRMAGKTLWAISSMSDEDRALAQPLFDTLRNTAGYLDMRWGGSLLGYGSRPGDVLQDAGAVAAAQWLLAGKPASEPTTAAA